MTSEGPRVKYNLHDGYVQVREDGDWRFLDPRAYILHAGRDAAVTNLLTDVQELLDPDPTEIELEHIRKLVLEAVETATTIMARS